MPTIEPGRVMEGTGLGTPLRSAGVPSGTTYQNVAAPGALLIDTTNKQLYQNTGTTAAPTWTKVGNET